MFEYIANNPIISCIIAIEILLIIDWIRVQLIPERNRVLVSIIELLAGVAGIVIADLYFARMIPNPGINLIFSIPVGCLLGCALFAARTGIVYFMIFLSGKFSSKRPSA